MGPVSEDFTRKQAILAGIPYIVTKQFPWKLHEMLEHVETDGNESIVSWLPSGRAFKVHRADEFVEKVMKNHFQQTKYKSFQRQLNLWGFERNTKESFERGSYCHPLFIKDRKDLCQEMGRQKVKPMSMSAKAAAALSSSSSTSPVPSTIFSKPAETPAAMASASAANTPSQLLMALVVAAQQQQQQMQQQAAAAANQQAVAASAAADLLNAAVNAQAQQQQQQQQQQQSNPFAALAGGSVGSGLIDALRLHNAVKQAGAASNNNNMSAALPALALLQQQQQSASAASPFFFSGSGASAPMTNTAATAVVPGGRPSSNHALVNPLAVADAEILQALQRRAALENFVTAAQRQQQQQSVARGETAASVAVLGLSSLLQQ